MLILKYFSLCGNDPDESKHAYSYTYVYVCMYLCIVKKYTAVTGVPVFTTFSNNKQINETESNMTTQEPVRAIWLSSATRNLNIRVALPVTPYQIKISKFYTLYWN